MVFMVLVQISEKIVALALGSAPSNRAGINFQKGYVCLCWSVPDPNEFQKYEIFSVLRMVKQNATLGSRGNSFLQSVQ